MDGGKREVNISLKRSLNRRILSASALLAVIASVVSGWIAFDEARELQDNLLRQVALLVDNHTMTKRLKEQNKDFDPEDTIVVQHLGDFSENNVAFPIDLADGLHTLDLNGTGWRVLYYTSQTDKSRFTISQQTEARDELAWNNSLDTLLPVLLLAPILMLIVNLAVRQSIKPVTELAKSIDKRNESNLELLPTTDVPNEITPFIASINRLLDRLNHAISQQRRFITDAAHELRTPVTGLSLLIDNLTQRATADDLPQRLSPIQEGLTRLKESVEQLLDLARLQNEYRIGTDKIDFQKVVQDVIAELYPLAEQKSIDLGVIKTQSLMLADIAGSLRILTRNAIENAIRYTPAGGKIDISLFSEQNDAVLLVEDTGVGIPKSELSDVFDPFYRVVDNTTEPGTGLGLAICNEIAAKLKGTISLTNRTERGLRFKYSQPIYHA